MTVENSFGKKIDYEMAVLFMDDKIRESLHRKLSPCSEQEFFDAYCAAHAKKYGEAWEYNKENPIL